MRNAISLRNSFRNTFAPLVPPTWQITINGFSKSFSHFGAEVHPATGESVKVAIEYVARLESRNVPQIAARLSRESLSNPILFSPYLSPATQSALKNSHINYLDENGNAYIIITSPFIFISRDGLERDPNPVARGLRSLSGPTSARVVRFLCDNRPPYGIRHIASEVDRNPGTVSRIIEYLASDSLVEKDSTATVTAVKWRELIMRWAPDLQKRRIAKTFIEPRGIKQFLAALPESKMRFALTGQIAARRFAMLAPTIRVQCYVDDIAQAASFLNVRPASNGSNVTLISAFDEVVYANSETVDGLTYAAPSQVAADVVIGFSRDPAEADAYLEWMKEHEDAWRR